MSERVCVIGLGNPGPRYQHTRHNIGFDWVDAALDQAKVSKAFSEKFQSLWCSSEIDGFEVHFLKPQTFMNESGRALVDWLNKFQGESRILVVYDEMDLPVGKIRFRPEGSDGGHRGLRSILDSTGTPQIPRLRIGVGRPEGDGAIDHVLERFKPEEKEILKQVLGSAGEQLKVWLKAANSEEAMNKLNGVKFKYGS